MINFTNLTINTPVTGARLNLTFTIAGTRFWVSGLAGPVPLAAAGQPASARDALRREGSRRPSMARMHATSLMDPMAPAAPHAARAGAVRPVGHLTLVSAAPRSRRQR